MARAPTLLAGKIAQEDRPGDPRESCASTLKRLESRCGRMRGSVTEHHLFMLTLHRPNSLRSSWSVDIERRLGDRSNLREKVRYEPPSPGVRHTTRSIASEMGVDVTRFRSADSLVSWAGLCPRSDESAGKRRSTRIRKGAQWLKTVLVQAAWAASRTKASYFKALYHRLKARRGTMKAIVAVAASMLRSVYFMLTRGQPYLDLGEHHFDGLARTKIANRLLKRLKDLGVDVLQVRVRDGSDLQLAGPVSL